MVCLSALIINIDSTILNVASPTSVARAATTSEAFNAIAEPQRQELGMTMPGASKHLRVLREVGLVQDRQAGKQRLYGLDEIVISRVSGAPRELVFEAFTEVRHLSQWWGPEGSPPELQASTRASVRATSS